MAQGVVMERFGLSGLIALAVLVQHAIDTGTELAAAADGIIRSAGVRDS